MTIMNGGFRRKMDDSELSFISICYFSLTISLYCCVGGDYA